MKAKQINNKVIIIGSNNYNELGLVRSFGVNGVRPYGLIVSDNYSSTKSFIRKSRYWKKTWVFASVSDAIAFLLDKFGNEEFKPLVITANDIITQTIDREYAKFSQLFHLQSFNQTDGCICNLSGKKDQADFAELNGFRFLKTDELQINDCSLPESFPVILKPAACGEGHKDDILICNSSHEYLQGMQLLQQKGYSRILRQPYLESKTEYVVLGALSPINNFISFTIVKNVRQWPEKYGVGSFAEFETGTILSNFAYMLFSSLIQLGYDGPIDIEIFLDDLGNIYINEINWRSSGRNYISLTTKVYSTVWWFYNKIGIDVSNENLINSKNGFLITECNDFNYVINNSIKLRTWLKEYFSSKSRSLWYYKDILPCVIPYFSQLKMYLKSRFK